MMRRILMLGVRGAVEHRGTSQRLFGVLVGQRSPGKGGSPDAAIFPGKVGFLNSTPDGTDKYIHIYEKSLRNDHA